MKMDDTTVAPFSYDEVVCDSDDPAVVIPRLWRALRDLQPETAKAFRKEYRYAQRRSYDVSNSRIELLLDTLFELLDTFAASFNAIFGQVCDKDTPAYAFIYVNS